MAELFGFLLQLLMWVLGIGLVLLVLVFLILLNPGQDENSSRSTKPHTPINVDGMSGRDFEAFVATLLHSRGFSTRVTSATGDFGADIVGTKAGIKYAIQCKRYAVQNKVSVGAVQEAVAAVPYYDCNKSMVITTGYFTKQAVQYARKVGCELVERDTLNTWIKGSKPTLRVKHESNTLTQAARKRPQMAPGDIAKIDDDELFTHLQKLNYKELQGLALRLGLNPGIGGEANMINTLFAQIKAQRDGK